MPRNNHLRLVKAERVPEDVMLEEKRKELISKSIVAITQIFPPKVTSEEGLDALPPRAVKELERTVPAQILGLPLPSAVAAAELPLGSDENIVQLRPSQAPGATALNNTIEAA